MHSRLTVFLNLNFMFLRLRVFSKLYVFLPKCQNKDNSSIRVILFVLILISQVVKHNNE